MKIANDIRKALEDPYFATDPEDYGKDDVGFAVGNDFNREIVSPGTNETFPDGAVGIRIDDDFWVVGALPYSYRDTSIEDIVAEFWPEVTNPRFNADSTYSK